MKNKGFIHLVILLVVILLAALAAVVISIKKNKSAYPTELTENIAPQDYLSKPPQNGSNTIQQTSPFPEPVTEKKSTTPGWMILTNKHAKFSVEYPNSWYNVSTSQFPDIVYLSNQEVGAPLEMTDEGIWITVHIKENDKEKDEYFSKLFKLQINESFESEFFITTKLQDLKIDGKPAVKYAYKAKPGVGTESGEGDIFYAVNNNGLFYEIDILSLSSATIEENQNTIDTIVFSFKTLE